MTSIDKIAWFRLEGGRILSTRSHGKDVHYIPGGKREPGESDVQTLVREIGEELTVAIVADSAVHVGTFAAQAHGHAAGTTVRMTCYTADYQGTLTPSSEVEEVVRLTCADRGRVSPVDRLVFDHLHRSGRLRQGRTRQNRGYRFESAREGRGPRSGNRRPGGAPLRRASRGVR
ncbi:MAG TPA: NUDIX domain-containing protein [Streptomyces sp.]|uniref:NUDIX hydrolase n=1 Tax=Streptomyces sp. TaxID=1931 RepID=UPI002D4E6F46|nr:NUDIX domain-containing protein [Streptomyces sp.]HZG07284.1 NUDIX domain-containing protein [Streptomyces sp.]